MTAESGREAHSDQSKGSYHHGDLRAALIDAAVEGARRSGLDGVRIREATRAVGVSPNAAYRHFADRDALVLAVALHGQKELAAAMRARMSGTEDGATDAGATARARLRAVGLGYIAFARAQPGLFEATFATRDERAPGDATVTVAQRHPEPFLLLLAALDRCVDAGVLTPERRANAEWACWSTVHGFAVFATSGPLREQPDEVVDALARDVVDTVVRGLLG